MPNTAVRVGEGAAVFCLGQVILVTLVILVILVTLVIIIVDKVSCFMMIIFVMMQDSGIEEGVTVSKLFSALGLCRQVRSASASSLSS